MLLESFIQGQWRTGSGQGVPLHDATSGAVVAEASAAGIDFAAALDYARAVGGPALRALTFHERAGLLKILAKALGAHKDELYALSYRTGATKNDSRIDIDGGISTLFVYASKGVRELPNGRAYIDGAAEPLSKNGKFLGQHLCVPLTGAAVHINAFNFPVWGMLEKLAPTVLAGVPTIVKPAGQTAYLTALVVRDIIASGALPEGALQLVCGGAGDLLDRLGGEDMIAFTGSARTAATLRGHAAVTARAARFNAETDSLNCSILGPDAVAGTQEFDLFVKEVGREITMKAGQRCTCIRRALVPESAVDDVLSGLRGRLDRVVVGNPRSETVTMGSLVSLRQRDEVRNAVNALTRAADVVYGDPLLVAAVVGDPERGAFMAPVVLLCNDVDRAEPHEVEAFGPVTTIIPYRDPPDAAHIAARGGGSLVGSIVSYDADFVRDVVLDTAPHHGRLLVLDRDCAGESTGHGSAIPQMVHGGPGRAGGGEELGGMRAVRHYMQRTGLQGSPAVIAALTGDS